MSCPSDLNFEEIRSRQANIGRCARLSWVQLSIILASLVVTLLAWYTSYTLVGQSALRHYDREIERVLNRVDERMKHYEDALLSGVSAIESNGGMATRDKWRLYSENLKLTQRYPGVNGIGVIHYLESQDVDQYIEKQRLERALSSFSIYPPHVFDIYLPITYIEPEGPNKEAIGLDIAFEKNRRDAALAARYSGETQISGPIQLVQDAGKTPGFLFFAPFYNGDNGSLPTATDREGTFMGLVYAPLIVKNLIAGTLDRSENVVNFTIRDGDVVLYSDAESGGIEQADNAQDVIARELWMYGRNWVFEFSERQLAAGVDILNLPTLVLITGLFIDIMLIVLFLQMASSNRRALALADTLTEDLSQRAEALQESNDELSSYAHVVSHDLKTPLRGIHDLTDFIREDLADYMASPDANPEVDDNLRLLERQVTRAESLITSILQFSGIGKDEEVMEIVNVNKVVQRIGCMLDVKEGQLVIEGSLPVFETSATRLDQVLTNLISNAFKYNHDPENAIVRVSVERKGAFYTFSVADNGPGIDPRFHESAFDAFKKLHTDARIDSSGIGLSIVKKSVELLGGRVWIESVVAPEPGHGTTFLFEWPSGDASTNAAVDGASEAVGRQPDNGEPEYRQAS